MELQALYAQNAFDITGLGGYAVMFNATPDTITGIREYTNYNTGSLWTEFMYTGEKITPVFLQATPQILEQQTR
jgi:hypothetical protein